MSRGDDRTAFAALLIRRPAHCIALAADLHRILVFVPGANAPDRVVLGELVSDIGVVGSPQRARAGENEEYTLVRAGRVHAIPTQAVGTRDARQPIQQQLLVDRPLR